MKAFSTFVSFCMGLVAMQQTNRNNMSRKRRKSKEQRREEARRYKHVRSGATVLDVGQSPSTRWKSKNNRKNKKLNKKNKKRKNKIFPKIKYAFRFTTTGINQTGE